MFRVALFRYLVLVLAAFLAVPVDAANAKAAQFNQSIEAAKSAMMSDPQQALRLVDQALAQAKALPEQEQNIARATALWLRIEGNIGLNRLTEAERHLAEALTLVTSAARDTKLHGDLLRSKGAVAAINGNSPEALRSYLAAHRIYKRVGDKRAQAIALQDIGSIYGEAGDYERELAFAEEAQEVYDDDPGFALTTNNNRGEAYRILGRGKEAEQAFLAALSNARELSSPLLETRILTNLALVQIELGKLQDAARNAVIAERLGANSEASDWLPFVYGVQAAIAAKRGEDQTAIVLIEQLFEETDLGQTDLAYKEFHELAADLYTRTGQPAEALPHLVAFQRLDSEARDLISTASSQLLGAQFNSANQKARIAELKQGQLERDFEIAQQKTMIVQGLLVAALALIIVAGMALVSIRRSRNEVRAANTVLTQVNTKLELALKAKTDFLAMTSHEIRTPLNGIMGMTQVLLADQDLDPQTRERVSLVLGAGQTMQSLVDDLLDVAKMENGGITVNKAPTDLRAVLTEGVRFWDAEASAKGVDIAFVEKDPIPVVYTDAGRLRQVIFNLLANAIKFTSSGGITVTAGRNDAQMLEIMVADTGIGIPEDQLVAVFEAFHQVDNGMSRDFGGAGLGLAICRNIMTALGGTISVTSTVGRGSVFCLTLPLIAEPAEAIASGAKAPAAVQNMLKAQSGAEGSPEALSGLAVIVDSNELRLAKVKAVIQPHSASVVGVPALCDAERLLQSGQVNQMVVDTAALSAEVDKLGALADLLALARANDVRVIVLLGADDGLPVSAVQAASPDVLLQKPLKAAHLIEAVKASTSLAGFQSQVA
jgi:signal transduction histidine kinase